jgi:hypothetical protein
MRRRLRIAAGALMWAAAVVGLGRLLLEGRQAAGVAGGREATIDRLARFVVQREASYRIVLPEAVVLKLGDVVEANGRAVGEVTALLDGQHQALPHVIAVVQEARIRIFDRSSPVLHAGAQARLVQVPQAAAWVIRTLFTEETVARIAAEWNRTMLEHRDEVFALLTPIIRDFLIDLEGHVERSLPGFLQRHAEEVRVLREEIERELRDDRLAEIFEKEIWPSAQPRVREVIEKVTEEVWQKVPLWGLTWRLAYQTLPLTDNDHVQRAFTNFIEGEVLPILKSHTDELITLAREIAREAMKSDAWSSALRKLFGSLVTDPRFHALVQAFLREVMLDNPDYHDLLWRRLRSPEVAKALEVASLYFEPMVRRMGDIVLGTREAGITQEFAKVLRSQILLKDLQRIVLDPGPDSAPRLEEGSPIEARSEVEFAR